MKSKINIQPDLFSCNYVPSDLEKLKSEKHQSITTRYKFKFIDLFAGMGGIRLGLEQAAEELGIDCSCVFTSEIKPHAIKVLQENYPNEIISGDITSIPSADIPDFDILLAGFPCQAFSTAGKREGFIDTRGTLFFEIERILREKKPIAFLLENVEGLISHNKENKQDPIGRTLSTILECLETLGYHVSWRVLNAIDFGVPQERKRIYLVGTQIKYIDIPLSSGKKSILRDILENGLPSTKNEITNNLLGNFTIEELYGRSIKDKRGGRDNIHSWDISLKGTVSKQQKILLDKILTERRKKKWAGEYGIDWMDGMPLSLEQINSFISYNNLEQDLESLANMGYLKKEFPKRMVLTQTPQGIKRYRVQDTSLPLGYNIIAGKLSYPISKILDPNKYAPTLVATDMGKLYVPDNGGLRPLSIREGLRLSGYPESYRCTLEQRLAYDLIGNTVVVPVIQEVAKSLLKALI